MELRLLTAILAMLLLSSDRESSYLNPEPESPLSPAWVEYAPDCQHNLGPPDLEGTPPLWAKLSKPLVTRQQKRSRPT